jgi:hypothetical protein
MIRRSLFSKDFLTLAWSEPRLGRMRLASGQGKGIAAGVNAELGTRHGGSRERAGSQAYRVSRLAWDGLAAQCVASLQMLLAVPGNC